MTLDEARDHIGDGVVYQPYQGAPAEDGTITRVTDAYVFVLYAGDRQPKATRAGDLTLLARAAVVADPADTPAPPWAGPVAALREGRVRPGLPARPDPDSSEAPA